MKTNPIPVAAALLMATFAFAKAQASGYTVTDLGVLGGTDSSAGYSINAEGNVTGYSYQTSGSFISHAVLFSGGTITDLGTFGGWDNFGLSINDSNQIAGYSNLSGNQSVHAFFWSQSVGLLDLGTLGGTQSYGRGISNSGLVVGNSNLAGDNSHFHAFIYSSATGIQSIGWSVNTTGNAIPIPDSLTSEQREGLIKAKWDMIELFVSKKPIE